MTTMVVSSAARSSSDSAGLATHEAPVVTQEGQLCVKTPKTPASLSSSQNASEKVEIRSRRGGLRTLATPATPGPREGQGTTGHNLQDGGVSGSQVDCPT